MNRPLFSIVIPTRSRSRYLKYALQSCLTQQFDDYEIVVSDNNSTDDTAKVTREMATERVRYVHTGRDLSCTDSFEFGVSQARGEYVLLLADDEAYKPTALKRLKTVIDRTDTKVVSFGRTSYIYPSPDGETGNTLLVRPFTGRVARLSAEALLKLAFSLRQFEEYYFGRALPLSVKTAVRRDVIDAIVKQVGCFQLPPTPDWSSAMMILAHVPNLVLLDEHLNVAGLVPESQGPKFAKTRQIDSATAEGAADFTSLTPLPVHTLYNLCVNAMLIGQRAVKPRLDSYSIDLPRYFRLINRELEVQRQHGVNIEDDIALMRRRVLDSGLDPDAILDPVSKPRDSVGKRGVGGAAVLSGLFQNALGRFRKHRAVSGHTSPIVRNRWPVRYKGSEHGFSTIVECASCFDQLTAALVPDAYADAMFAEAYGSGEYIETAGPRVSAQMTC
ncbi:MAG: glycosyltransferase family A protein [Chloroflexi bacterium]|nr:glycosyltransferase family A protein [Chloroflexota bacterium]